MLGGFRAQGRTAARARSLLDEALRLQDAGAFAVVLECIPANVATAITNELEIPTIGIGAGGGTSGQVLVFHDLLGMLSHPHHEEFVPKFCKKYASVGLHINDGLAQFKKEVEDGVFPGNEYSPYAMSEEEETIFDQHIAPGLRITAIAVGAMADYFYVLYGYIFTQHRMDHPHRRVANSHAVDQNIFAGIRLNKVWPQVSRFP